MTLPNADAPNKPNPTVAVDIGAQVPLYEDITAEIQGLTKAGVAAGVESVLAVATFSSNIVERDHAVVPQNCPLHDNVRVPASISVTSPAAGDLIEATNATSTGLQDGFEAIILAHVFHGDSNLIEDQGYFCISVPMH